MAGNGRRHPSTPQFKSASVHHGPNTYQVKIMDVSKSGAAIETVLPRGKSRVKFDLGDKTDLFSGSPEARECCVVRHYDGGFTLNFDGLKRLNGKCASPTKFNK